MKTKSNYFVDQEMLKVQEINRNLELKPCPCCGGIKLYSGPATALTYAIKCTACGVNVTKDIPDRVPKGKDYVTVTLESAAADWNKRATAATSTCRPMPLDAVLD